MNPEFRRNLWLELPAHRLIALPAVLLLVFLAAWLAGGRGPFVSVSEVVLVLLVVLWGGRLAAETVIEEVVGRTWDNQRMSAIGPWDMTWGKLLGSTIYVWYGGLWCVIAFMVGGGGQFADVVRLILAGAQAQATALLLSMLLLRSESGTLRFQVTISQLLTLLLMVPFLLFNSFASPETVRWYGFTIPDDPFVTVSQIAFLGWTVLGIYQLMRGELQYRTTPALWFLFVIFAAAYMAGFDSMVAAAKGARMPSPTITRLFLAFIGALTLTYVSAFVEPKSPVRLRRWLGHFNAGRIVQMSQIAPTFVPALLVALLSALLVVVNSVALNSGDTLALINVLAFIFALLMFAVRDLAMLYYLVLFGGSRGHLAGVVYLISAYFLAPVVLSAARLDAALPILLPYPNGPWEMVVLPVLGEALLAFVVLSQRWRSLTIEGMEQPTPGASIPGRSGHSGGHVIGHAAPLGHSPGGHSHSGGGHGGSHSSGH
jgi:hypothetical protein